ncbi:MAG: L-2-amino-thiazoline-4-carboxylic acid hydrolase [Propionibacteriaceae bacterium]|jgi:hypothetical protein|nr:L-2-amino-thiazoline-4-carboxylic acid hydrolase [Propionibacteriaceae bacterium]
MADFPEIPILQRREIEARVLAPVYEIMVREFGEERAKAVLTEAIEKDAMRAGAAVSAGVAPDKTLRAFIDVQPLWTAGGALEEDVQVATDEEYSYVVTRCAYAELYTRLGIRDLGEILSCHRDAAFIKGVDPAIEFERDSTIMSGDATCVFRYRLPKP